MLAEMERDESEEEDIQEAFIDADVNEDPHYEPEHIEESDHASDSDIDLVDGECEGLDQEEGDLHFYMDIVIMKFNHGLRSLLQLLLLVTQCGRLAVGANTTLSFPDGFIFGTATAAYQVEGGWNEGGKGENIWDRMTHEHPEYIEDRSNGDIACDSYHLYEEDVRLLKELGVDFYRFSISWTRILPSGEPNDINKEGIEYYNKILDLLAANNISAMVTIYHWDLPQRLQDMGGWTNPLIANYYEMYANVLFQHFGDRVRWWITFNEPDIMVLGYTAVGGFAPSVNLPDIGNYMVIYTFLLAHAKAYHLYDEHYRADYKGEVGITVQTFWYEPLTNSSEDIAAAERALQFSYGLYVNAILSEEGDYPEIVKEVVGNKSRMEGRPRSRLLPFTQEQIDYIRGTADFVGINYYTARYVTSGENSNDAFLGNDPGVETLSDPTWESASTSYMKVVPWGIRKLINWVWNTYNGPRIIITENGYSDDGSLDDIERVKFTQSHLEELLKAVYEDGCDVFGYTMWSLMDNFEWNSGYTQKYGLIYVDFDDPNRTRTPKHDSFPFVQNIIKTRELPILE